MKMDSAIAETPIPSFPQTEDHVWGKGNSSFDENNKFAFKILLHPLPQICSSIWGRAGRGLGYKQKMDSATAESIFIYHCFCYFLSAT